jgi:hypothetical protein
LVEIDTDLANKEVFENYANNEIEQVDQNNDINAAEMIQPSQSDTPKSLLDSDALKDKGAKKFLEGLKKIGPFSKHILNYSYPPLLYQRGDDEEEEDES